MGEAPEGVDAKRFKLFQEACRKAGVVPDKPLYAALATCMETALIGYEIAKGGARGLTPEGEKALVERVAKTADGAMREYARRQGVALQRLTACLVGGAVALSLGVGVGVGYWRGRASVVDVAGQVEAAALIHGAAGAEVWLGWMRSNDPVRALETCSGGNVWVVGGRKACAVSLWIDEPGVPVAGR
jgi:hypothetical protein